MEITSIDDIRAISAPVLKKTPAQKAYVFGAWARGTQTRRSDIDMMVISSQGNVRYFDRYKEFDGLYEALGTAGLDLLIYSKEELDAMSGRPFIKTVVREGVLVYER
jgi:predicted nucleotidyltransferase